MGSGMQTDRCSPRRDVRRSEYLGLLVNLPTVANKVQIKAPELQIELIKHAVVSNTELVFATALEPRVRKALETGTHFVHFVLHRIPHRSREHIKRARIRVRPDLERR